MNRKQWRRKVKAEQKTEVKREDKSERQIDKILLGVLTTDKFK